MEGSAGYWFRAWKEKEKNRSWGSLKAVVVRFGERNEATTFERVAASKQSTTAEEYIPASNERIARTERARTTGSELESTAGTKRQRTVGSERERMTGTEREGTAGTERSRTDANLRGLQESNSRGLPESNSRGLPEPNVTGWPEPNGLGLQAAKSRGLQEPNGRGLPEPNGRGRQEANVRGLSDPHGRGLPDPNGRGLPDPNGRGRQEPNGRGRQEPNGRGRQEPNGRGRQEPNGRGRQEPNGRGRQEPNSLGGMDQWERSVMEEGMKASEGRVDGRINAQERRMDSVRRWASEQKRGLAVFDTAAEGRERLKATKDIEDHSLRACDSGKKVTRMLEANRIQEEGKLLEEELRPPKSPDLNWRTVASGFTSYDNKMMQRSQETKLFGSNLEDKVVLQRGVMLRSR
ncbi:germ cell nuclear acidic protein-like [Vigna umbellata]|uniref:germ cell nuclear acidic protein-like n=1 Tax=Vigna umbellata TaxID=87088 RepID=UPI001F5FA378|nr:germ cell nuclear acidic protein-like [Vigna umbellata]